MYLVSGAQRASNYWQLSLEILPLPASHCKQGTRGHQLCTALFEELVTNPREHTNCHSPSGTFQPGQHRRVVLWSPNVRSKLSGSAGFPGLVPATSLPLAFVEQLERVLHGLPVKCDLWKTCIFVTGCVFLFRADTALFIYFPRDIGALESSFGGRFDRL